MPGRGGTSQPTGLWFGALGVQDYVAAVLGAFDQLKALHIRPVTMFAHSLGGVLVQQAQQRLVSQGTDLRTAYGVKDVVLLGSITPVQVYTYSIDSGMFNRIVLSLAQIDRTAGNK